MAVGNFSAIKCGYCLNFRRNILLKKAQMLNLKWTGWLDARHFSNRDMYLTDRWLAEMTEYVFEKRRKTFFGMSMCNQSVMCYLDYDANRMRGSSIGKDVSKFNQFVVVVCCVCVKLIENKEQYNSQSWLWNSNSIYHNKQIDFTIRQHSALTIKHNV